MLFALRPHASAMSSRQVSVCGKQIRWSTSCMICIQHSIHQRANYSPSVSSKTHTTHSNTKWILYSLRCHCSMSSPMRVPTLEEHGYAIFLSTQITHHTI